MAFSVIYSPVFLEHKPENYHPENPGRLLRAVEALKRLNLWKPIEPTPVPEEELLKVHSRDYVELVREKSFSFSYLDPDTYVSIGTWEAALTASQASCSLFAPEHTIFPDEKSSITALGSLTR